MSNDNKYVLNGFTAIRNEVFQANLTPSEFKVFLFLQALDWNERNRDRSYSFIANGVSLGERTVIRVIDALVAKGFVEKIKETTAGRCQSNKYKMLRSYIYRKSQDSDKSSTPSSDKTAENKTRDKEQHLANVLCLGQGPRKGVCGSSAHLKSLLTAFKGGVNE